jgi:hypothetical protein
MKFADRLKFTATGTSAATITLSAGVTGFRTLAAAIADGALAVGDTDVPFTVEDSAGNNETSLFTVTSATVLTRTSVLSTSAGGTTAATFTGATLTVFSAMPAPFATSLPTALTDNAGGLIGLASPNGRNHIFGSSNFVRPGKPAHNIYPYPVAAALYPGRCVHVCALRRKLVLRNLSTITIQVAPSGDATANAPGGWIDIPPGQQITECFTARQWFARPKSVTVTSATTGGSTVGTYVVPGHGLETGGYVEVSGGVPSGYNFYAPGRKVTVIDANTFTVAGLPAGLADATTMPILWDCSKSIEVETEIAL